ncbi:hypothetical protein [Methylobacterium aquaticum]|uniref:hypothetical protein n=1 Tax=Methylobacterium aquaticum TaxID=270351 RepID=UPI001933CD73|nr:hypothetical protein [Methylobacterium aquaticum]QRE76183.1 hypothetical protein F1D61_23795 [Methylobacterium aquaticum]
MPVTHPLANPELIDVIAEWLHERAKERVTWWPAWEDLDMTDPFKAGLIRSAYDRARAFVEMNGGGEE